MIRKLLFSSLVMCAASGAAQTDVTPFQPGKTTDGICYFLPRTAIHVKVAIQKTTYTPGEFARYAERYLHLNGVGQEPTTTWEIKGITLTSAGIPDSTKAFSIKLKDKTLAPLVTLTEEGIILSINKEVEIPMAKVDDIVLPEYKPETNPRQYMTEEILSAGSTAKMAELTAQEIYNIRESKNSITRGQAEYMPKDGQSMKLMLDEINSQEAALTSLFKGTTSMSSSVREFTFVPSKEIEKQVVFRFSQRLGALDADDLGGAPVYISITDMHSLPPTDEEAEKKKKQTEKGVFYTVPSKAKVRLFNSSGTLAEAEFNMGQFGKVELLSDALFGKKSTTKVQFHPTTGGIMKIED